LAAISRRRERSPVTLRCTRASPAAPPRRRRRGSSNEVQERLTIVATIFLPLTVITGFFGQNFAWLIGQIGSAWALWGLGIGGLLISGCAIVVWLVRSGLYHGPKL
jgi:hypothetical protein